MMLWAESDLAAWVTMDLGTKELTLLADHRHHHPRRVDPCRVPTRASEGEMPEMMKPATLGMDLEHRRGIAASVS